MLVADDHPIYREGIVRAINDRKDLELLGEAADGREALEQIKRLEPRVAVLDIRMPELAYRTVAAGARGFLSKESSRQEVCEAILAIAAGGTAFAAEVQAGLASQIQQRERAGGAVRPLSKREAEVLGLIAEGLSAPEIGERISVSTTTVKSHLASLYAKLGVSDRAAAVAEGMRRGLLE